MDIWNISYPRIILTIVPLNLNSTSFQFCCIEILLRDFMDSMVKNVQKYILKQLCGQYQHFGE